MDLVKGFKEYLNQFHDWDRVEEMETSELVLSAGHTGYLSDGKRGRVTGKQCGAE